MIREMCALLLLTGALCAGPEPAPDAQLAELAARDAKMRVLRNESRPERPVTGLIGDLGDARSGAAATAQAFVEKHGALLGFPPGTPFPGDYQTIRDEKDEDGQTLVLVPARNGVPYLAGSITFVFDRDGKLTGVQGRHRALDEARMGGMNAGQAAEKALEVLSGKFPGAFLSADGTVREHIAAAPGGGLQHVYEVELPIGVGKTPELVVLGPGGDVINQRSAAEAFDGSGRVLKPYPSRETEVVPLTDLVDKPAASAPKFKRLHGKYFYPQTDAIMVAASKDGKYDYPKRLGGELGFDLLFYDPRFLEVNVYHCLMQARKHAIDVAKVTEVDIGRAIAFNSWEYPVPGRKQSTNNLYYSNASRDFHMPVINVKFPSTPPLWETGAVDASMMYHEYGHHVLNVIARDLGAAAGSMEDLFETVSIGEGFSDYFSRSITGKDTVGEIFGAPSQTRKVGGLGVTRCNLKRYVENGKANNARLSPYAVAPLFSSLCVSLERVYGPRTIEHVTKAMRSAVPRTFSRFAFALGALAHTADRGRNEVEVGKVLDEYKMFECDYSETTPIPEGFDFDAMMQGGGL